MKKIIFSDNTLWGLLNFRGGVIKHLTENGYEVVLIAPKDELCDLTTIPAKVRYIPIELQNISKNIVSDIKYYKAIKTIYREEKPDYIFHYTIKPNIYGTMAAHSLGIRSSAMITGLGHVFTKGGIGNKIARLMYKYAMSFSERVFVLNRSNHDTLLKNRVVKKEKLLWLEGGEGVNLKQFSTQSVPNNQKPVFLMITRLLYEKGYAEYVNAANILKDKAEFRIMGPIYLHPSGVHPDSVRKDVLSGAIKHIEYSPDVVSQITLADCMVLPSFYGEGLSRVLMEGLAMGKPIVCTDIPGCRETVDNGVNGFLCQPRDSISLTKAFEKFIAISPDQRLKMGMESRKKAERIFDERFVIEKYQSLLDAVN